MLFIVKLHKKNYRLIESKLYIIIFLEYVNMEKEYSWRNLMIIKIVINEGFG